MYVVIVVVVVDVVTVHICFDLFVKHCKCLRQFKKQQPEG